MVRLLVVLNIPLVRVIGLTTWFISKVIVLPAQASLMAWRNAPGPLSAFVVTTGLATHTGVGVGVAVAVAVAVGVAVGVEVGVGVAVGVAVAVAVGVAVGVGPARKALRTDSVMLSEPFS